MKEIRIIEVGDILYNPKYNGFHQVRDINKDTAILSGCCDYIGDTKTTISNNEVGVDYLSNLISPLGFVERCDVVGSLRSPEDNGNKAYMFYKDPCVIRSWHN